jgi:hypothetical protein
LRQPQPPLLALRKAQPEYRIFANGGSASDFSELATARDAAATGEAARFS